MIRAVCLAILGVCCVFSVIPLTRLFFPSPGGPLLSVVLLIVVLFYSAFDIKSLYEKKKYDVARKSIVLMVVSVVFSFIALSVIWYYFRFYILPPIIA